MPQTAIKQLAAYGQSIWLDSISRSLIDSGQLKLRIEQGLRGITSNPSIFQQAISQSDDYDEQISQLHEQGRSVFEIYDALSRRDIQDAADCFKTVYDQTGGLDGYVSLEIDPRLAHQAPESIAEGIRLFQALNRPNVMIKVPATTAGYSVVEELIAKGINVNVTLIFSLEQYELAAQAYLRGLKRLNTQGGELGRVRSVASVFVSRLDAAVDKKLDLVLAGKTDAARAELCSLQGRAAVANCQRIFTAFARTFQSKDYQELAKAGAQVQRVLWASTGTKNALYSDIKYVSELICRPSVNTLPQKTLLAFMDHGRVQEAFGPDLEIPHDVFAQLKELDIDLPVVCHDLLEAGLVAFEDAFRDLLKSLTHKVQALS